MSICEKLSTCGLFNGFSQTAICDLLESIAYKKTVYEKNDIIAMDGDPVTGLYILLSGSVRGEMTNYLGKVVKIEDLEGCKLLAPAFIFGQDNYFPVDIIANEHAECIYLTKGSLLKLLEKDPLLGLNFKDIISAKTQFLSNKIKFLALQPLKGKIASYILKRLRHMPDNNVILPYSQEKLSDLFGVTRPALARAFGELVNQDILEIKGKKISVLNVDALRKFVQ